MNLKLYLESFIKIIQSISKNINNIANFDDLGIFSNNLFLYNNTTFIQSHFENMYKFQKQLNFLVHLHKEYI